MANLQAQIPSPVVSLPSRIRQASAVLFLRPRSAHLAGTTWSATLFLPRRLVPLYSRGPLGVLHP